ACLKRLEDWAERHELETRTSRKSRRFLVDGHVLVWAFPRWEAIQVDVWHLMETVPGAALAERIRTVCREQFGSTSKGLNWSGLDARTVVDQWERFEPDVLDPLLAGTRAPGTGEAESEDAGRDGDEPAAGLPESPDA